MKFLVASAGENVYNFLVRALSMAQNEVKTIQADHNGISVVIYPQSFISDICDKFDMTQKLKNKA